MQSDKRLVFCSPNLRETLGSFDRIEDNRSKLAMGPYPDDKVLLDFAELVYSDCSGEMPKGWYLLTTAQSKYNGYFGCATWNPSQQQVILAHRGTHPNNLGAIWIDAKGIFFNKFTRHMNSAVSFADEVKKAIIEINKLHGSRFVLSFTGHSLGAWLAGVTTLTVKHLKSEGGGFCMIASPDEGLHAHTLAFDSPGVEDMLIKICRQYDDRYNRSMCIQKLDITTFVAAANMINSTGFHVGGVRQVHIKRDSLRSDSEEPTLMRNIETHGIDNFTKAFKAGNDNYVVNNWPEGIAERKCHHRRESYCNSYILRPDAAEEQVSDTFEDDPEDMPSSHYRTKEPSGQDAGPLEHNAGRLSFIDRLKNKLVLEDDEETSSHYRVELSLGNSCKLGVFATTELEFLQHWKLFQSNSIIKLTEIDKFLSLNNLEKLDFPKFKLDSRCNTITCKSAEHLVKIIRQAKQLLRWFPGIMDVLKQQNCNIKSAPLYMAGQAYLRTFPDILDCKDTLGLETFLESSEQRVLHIQTTDVKFEAARLHNILIRIKNTKLKKIYLKEKCRTFLSWTDMTVMANNVDIEGLNMADVTNDNLLILCFENQADSAELNHNLFGRILNNLKTCSHKKLVIVLHKLIVLHNIFTKYNLAVETKPFKVFNLNDLSVTSRERIFARDVAIIGEETLSLDSLLGDDCKSHDKTVQSKITKLISPILKTLATDNQYIINIPNNLARHCELDALYSKGNKLVDKAKLIALLETSGAAGPLLVISDPGQLSQKYWGEMPDSAEGRIFNAATEKRDMFQEKCREERERIIYWFNLSEEGLTLREVYTENIYLPRKFYSRFIIKSINEFVRYSGSKDLFIFNNGKDKKSLIRHFELSEESEDLFIKNDHFKMRIPSSQELNREDKIKGDLLNKHFFSLCNITGSLVWRYSKGSLDGLRPFITRDYRNPINEKDFSNTKKKLVIIADDPGMGKTTSLTRISELIQDAWVLRIDHKRLESATANLPPKLDLTSAIDCLMHLSGLSRDTDMVRRLLRYCLESDNSRQVCVLLDAFDQITDETTMVKMVVLIFNFLKTKTTCRSVVTTRVYQQESLEKGLEEFSVEFKKITGEEQEKYMVDSWLPHLALELPQHGELEERRLHQFARELRQEMEGVLGEDVANFMGVPLQISMVREVFLRQALLHVVSPEQVNNFKIINLFDLYKQFIEVKKTIYLEQKAAIIKLLPLFFQNELFTKIWEKHYFLALQLHDPTFANKQFTNIDVSPEDLKDISTVGLIRYKTDGTFPFIHRTFQEYFCSDFFVKWLRQKKKLQKRKYANSK